MSAITLITHIQERVDVCYNFPEDKLVFAGVKPALFCDASVELYKGLRHKVYQLWPRGQVVQDIVSCENMK